MVLFIVTAFSSLVLSIAATTRGSNYDFASYLIVVDAAQHGEDAWTTNRYNYGPIWANVLVVLKAVSPTESIFRLSIVVALWIALVTIALVFWRHISRVSSLIVLLSPISIIITGYHNQFDVIAIAIAILAILFLERWEQVKLTRYFFFALVLLGVSLSVKHIILLLLLWLALRPYAWRHRLALLTIPPVIFAASFLPFLPRDFDPIWRNVVSYQSSKNPALIGYFIDQTTAPAWLSILVFITGLSIGAMVTRRWSPLLGTCAYLVTLVLFTPAMANQYLLIAGIGSAAFIFTRKGINYGFLMFTALAGLFLVTDVNGLHMTPHIESTTFNNPFSEYGVLLVVLAIGWLQMLVVGNRSDSMAISTQR